MCVKGQRGYNRWGTCPACSQSDYNPRHPVWMHYQERFLIEEPGVTPEHHQVSCLPPQKEKEIKKKINVHLRETETERQIYRKLDTLNLAMSRGHCRYSISLNLSSNTVHNNGSLKTCLTHMNMALVKPSHMLLPILASLPSPCADFTVLLRKMVDFAEFPMVQSKGIAIRLAGV